MIIHVPAFEPMLKANEHLRHGAFDIDLGENVVEVVRCKDCKHFTGGMAIGMCKRIPDKPIIPMPHNNYCGFGIKEDRGAEDG